MDFFSNNTDLIISTFRTIRSSTLLLFAVFLRVPVPASGEQLPQGAGGGGQPLLHRLQPSLHLPETHFRLPLASWVSIFEGGLLPHSVAAGLRIADVPDVSNVLSLRTRQLPVRLPTDQWFRLPWTNPRVGPLPGRSIFWLSRLSRLRLTGQCDPTVRLSKQLPRLQTGRIWRLRWCLLLQLPKCPK